MKHLALYVHLSINLNNKENDLVSKYYFWYCMNWDSVGISLTKIDIKAIIYHVKFPRLFFIM